MTTDRLANVESLSYRISCTKVLESCPTECSYAAMRLQSNEGEKQMISDTITQPEIVQGLQAHDEFIGMKEYHVQI